VTVHSRMTERLLAEARDCARCGHGRSAAVRLSARWLTIVAGALATTITISGSAIAGPVAPAPTHCLVSSEAPFASVNQQGGYHPEIEGQGSADCTQAHTNVKSVSVQLEVKVGSKWQGRTSDTWPGTGNFYPTNVLHYFTIHDCKSPSRDLWHTKTVGTDASGQSTTKYSTDTWVTCQSPHS